MSASPPQATAEAVPTVVNPANNEAANELLADTNYEDSTFGGSEGSETTSIASVYKGYFEHGRRYQSLRSEEYHMPTDEKQWESMEAGHMVFLILDSQRSNVLFRSPISSKAQHILDLGTGQGSWALAVADKFPNITVYGVDLYPPPQQWTAPNCIFEVDDLSKPWTWNHKFDLIHLRSMLGSLDDQDWTRMYRRAYNNLEPGGWIEQLEPDITISCDDDTLPADSMLATQWAPLLNPVAESAGRRLNNFATMRGEIEAAGFINVHQQDYKCPIGTWPSLQVYKDAGRAQKQFFKAGMEGWVMSFLTKFGLPKPWSPEEVQVYLAKIRNELEQGWHIYQKARRVWAQKPFDAEPKEATQGAVDAA